MRARRIILSALLCVILFSFNKSLPIVDETIFRAPLDINLYLAGAFGEPRGDHFHTGVDFSTRGKTGLEVKAVADGYVSRIKVQAGGYGHALYITHPNGYISVYGHLTKYSETIEEYVQMWQFTNKSFEVDLYPEKDLLKVKHGDIVAYSGNTGTSTAPHLHFEIRDASGESFPLNPLKWISIEDHKAPVINGFAVYALSSGFALSTPKLFSVVKNGNSYSSASTIITNDAKTGIGIRAMDFMDVSDADGDFGIYSVKSTIDGKNFLGFSLNRLDFSEGRFANAHIDYSQKRKTSLTIYRNFLLPGNSASIYDEFANRGVINFSDTLIHKIEITVSDYSGNSSVVKFNLKYRPLKSAVVPPKKNYQKLFLWNQANSYATDSFKISLPAGLLYDDLYFNCKRKQSSGGKNYSATFSCGDWYTPLHNFATISILPNSIPEKLKSKAVICFRNYIGAVSGKTTSWNGNFLETKIREFGEFFVMLDTIKPTVTILNLVANQTLTGDNIKVKINDNLSGVTKYNGYIDGEWILMELDFISKTLIWKKNAVLPGVKGKNYGAGEHILKLVVSDEVGNINTTTLKFKI